MKCSKCGSNETVKHGFLTISGGKRVQQYQCKKCGYVGRMVK